MNTTAHYWVQFVGTTGFGANDTLLFARLAKVSPIEATDFFGRGKPVLVSGEDIAALKDAFRGRLDVQETKPTRTTESG